MDDCQAVAEIKAAALEAIGDDARAALAYAHRVELQARRLDGDLNNGWISWLRDWWVGRAYAQCVARSGRSKDIEKSLRDELAKSSRGAASTFADRTQRMLLAFVLEAQGKEGLAWRQWQSMLPQSEQQAASLPASQPAVEAKSGL
jgi:hypothetical protein